MRTLLCGLSIALCWVSSLPAQDKAAKKPELDLKTIAKEPKVAVVVGISEYDGPQVGFSALNYADKDAEELAEVLRKQGFRIIGRCPKGQDRSDGGCALTNANANKNRVKEALALAVDAVQDGHGTLVFAFSGHGLQKSEDQPQYLALNGANLEELEANSLRVDDLKKILRNTSARRMLFIDACRGAPDSDDTSKPKPAERPKGFYGLEKAFGMRIMYSTRYPYSSWEDPDLGGGHGRFSYYLAQGLSGKGTDPKTGLLTFDSLYEYVHQEIQRENDKHKDKIQFINEDGDHDSNFYIAGELKDAQETPAEEVRTVRNRRVLLMGNDVYPQMRLASAVADIQALRERFTSNLGMDPASITVLTNATKKQMDETIVKFTQAVEPNDDVIVYFSGMGAMAGDEPYVTPSDYRLSESVSPHRGIHALTDNSSSTDYENWVGIPVRKIVELLSLKPGVRKIMMFDMCLTPVKTGIPGWALPLYNDGTTVMLFAASPGHEAQETPEHGYFTASVLQAIDSDPKISWNAFASKVWAQTREVTHGQQAPFLAGYLRDNFDFSVK